MKQRYNKILLQRQSCFTVQDSRSASKHTEPHIATATPLLQLTQLQCLPLIGRDSRPARCTIVAAGQNMPKYFSSIKNMHGNCCVLA